MFVHIKEVVEALANSDGNDFFTRVAITINTAVAADCTFVARVNQEKNTYKTEAIVIEDAIAENIENSLQNTPSAKVIENNLCYYPENVCSLYPDDQLLKDLKAQAYIGVSLVDSKQKLVGIIIALFKTTNQRQEDTTALLQLFSGHVAVEIERIDYQQALEEKITAQTLELSNTIDQLKITQKQLVESEKMSALGSLVAGVSHEVNTPLGIAITTHSVMADALKDLNHKLEKQILSVKDMQSFRHILETSLTMQGENLLRAKKLIANFKKTAADQHQLDIEMLDIGAYYQQVISTLSSILKPYDVDLEISCDDEMVLATYPGIHAQILTNLVNNSVKHGFSINNNADVSNSSNTTKNKISIVIKQLTADEVEVKYSDNGKGLSEEAKTHTFDPFFTTARKTGGIGLGMSIVYNLITQQLNGSIKIEPLEKGVCFHYKFKESVFNLDAEKQSVDL